jgi:hypothetical protein
MLRIPHILSTLAALALACSAAAQVTSKFQGVKANTGTCAFSTKDGKRMLTLSNDFVVPDTPAPHWQVVDAAGQSYLLQRLKIKGDKVNTAITLPSYVGDVAKVQIWCAFAETLLGEASFAAPACACPSDAHKSSKFAGIKASTGTVTHQRHGSQSVLTLSEDFVVPDAPAPHWQVVDSKGNTYLLAALKIKGDKMNRTLTVPTYVHDIAKVQIWCAFAEVLLGEASFGKPVM